MFKKYIDNNRNNGGNQSEKSYFTLEKNKFNMFGYHNYTYDKTLENPIVLNNYKQIKQLELIDNIKFDKNSALLDLGCGNGAIGLFMLLKYNFNKLILVDHDKEYIDNINSLILWSEKLKENVTTINTDFKENNVTGDYVLALSLIHWLYSVTSDYGCLFKVIEAIKKFVTKGLIVEWIDNEDSAIKYFSHISFNKEIHKTEYNKENFIKALNNNFKTVEFIGKSTETREIYYCEL